MEDPNRQRAVSQTLRRLLFVMVSSSPMFENEAVPLLLLADEVSLGFRRNVLESATFRVRIRHQYRETHVLAQLSVC